jgi:hypothetical protein
VRFRACMVAYALACLQAGSLTTPCGIKSFSYTSNNLSKPC